MERENSSGSNKIQIPEPNQLCLPEEIIVEILSRLPVYSLLKFRCVSKSWCALIDSQQFIKIHHTKSIENPCFSHHRVILNPIRLFDPDRRILLICNWPSLFQDPVPDPFVVDDRKDIYTEVYVVGCCNGLVCFLQEERFKMWNPSTRMCLILPEAVDYTSLRNMDIRMYGFGYDESSNDYRVCTILTSDRRPPIGRVYSFRSHSWKTVEENINSSHAVNDSGVFVCGNLHWLGNVNDYRGIVLFDLKNMVYGMVEQPSKSYSLLSRTQTLGVIDGCLSVVCDFHSSHFDVWVMKEYGVKDSWVNLFTIACFNHSPLRTQELRTFCRGPNGEFLLIYDSTIMIYCYYPEDNEFLCSSIYPIDKVLGECIYVESLISLGPYAEHEDCF